MNCGVARLAAVMELIGEIFIQARVFNQLKKIVRRIFFIGDVSPFNRGVESRPHELNARIIRISERRLRVDAIFRERAVFGLVL